MRGLEHLDTQDVPDISETTLREVVDVLAPLDRAPCSSGERQAAAWLADRFARAGCSDVRLEDEDSWGTWPPTLSGLGTAALAAGLVALRGRRLAAGALAAGALAALVDEIQNGPRVVRRALRRRRKTVNVVAVAGDPDAERTLVVLAHHDAAQAGRIFDQTWAQMLHARRPDLMENRKTQIPQWWAGVVPGLLTLLGTAANMKAPIKAGVAVSLLATAAVLDIATHPTVPGANDNLSGVAVQVALAEALRASPVPGVRVLLVSCGAEETLQDGVRGFVARHRADLRPDRTWFLNFDTVGSSDLIMLEGEGPVWMEDYAEPSFRDLVAACARAYRVPLDRGFRSRASTDSIIPSRAGYPTATVVSLTPWRLPGNYHQMSDVPQNLNFHSVTSAARLGLGLVHALRPVTL